MALADPASQPGSATAPRELTLRGFVLGAVLALILGAANAYLGLYAGMTVSASIPASVISMAVLQLLGRGTILENNVVQTIASAGEAVAAGAIFTFPALVILGDPVGLSYRDVTMLCLAGGTMGSLLVVFLRRTYIVEERLPFPEGRACANVLRAGESGGVGAGALAAGGLGAAIVKVAQDVLGLVPDGLSGSFWAGRAAVTVSANLSAALLGVGYIVGIEIAVLIFAGGALGWFVAIPLVSAAHPELRILGPAIAAHQVWIEQTRYLGVGAMLVGGAATLWRLRGPITRGLAESLRVTRGGGAATTHPREDTDLPAGVVVAAVGLCVPIIFVIIWLLSHQVWLSLALAVALVIIGFFATAVAGYLTGIVGASNNPVSGVTIMVLLAIALILEVSGVGRELGPRLAIMAAAVVCTAAAMAGDSLHDLATGFHVRASPWALELAVLTGAAIAALVMAPILNLLIRGYGIAGAPGASSRALAAPQAFLMAKVAHGVFSGGLPWETIAAGALLAAGLLFADRAQARRQSRWRMPVMPVAIGLYLPFGLGTTILTGALIRAIFVRRSDPAGRGALIAAGMIAGEALTGVLSGALITAGINLPLR